MQAHLFAIVESKADGINLAAYPGLTYAPDHWGPGIRFAHNGREVKEVAEAAGFAAASGIQHIAEKLGVPFADVCDALKFLRDQQAI